MNEAEALRMIVRGKLGDAVADQVEDVEQMAHEEANPNAVRLIRDLMHQLQTLNFGEIEEMVNDIADKADEMLLE